MRMQAPPGRDIAASPDLIALERWATEQWTPEVAAMVQGAAGTRATVSANVDGWREWHLRPRVLVDVGDVRTVTTVLGQPVPAPVLVAPSGQHTLVDPDGEVATALGARDFGTIMVLSSGTGRSIEDVRAVGGSTWFQFYWGRDRERLRDLLQRAVALGCRAVCLTADLPVPPLLDASMRHAVAHLPGDPPRYLLPRSAHVEGGEWDHDARLNWRDLEWLRGVVDVPVVIKGISTGSDARAAADTGCAAIVVSNHGGRTLDDAWPTARSLAEVVQSLNGVADAPEVLVDGGIRRGRDVAVALALGARAVLIGRPVLWGLAAQGASGVAGVLRFFARELATTMALVGAPSVADLGPDRVAR